MAERTMLQLIHEVMEVQSACNLCAVAQSFARAMIDLTRIVPSTDERNTHPVAVLWADKIAHLTRTQSLGLDQVTLAYDWCFKEVGVKSS